MKLSFTPNMASEAPGGGIGNVSPAGGPDTADSEKRALNILQDDSEPEVEEEESETPEVGTDETEETEEQPTEDVPEEDETTETPEEEELPEVKPDDLTVSGKVAYDKLKEKYPQVIKEIPELRQLFFREKAFSDIYTTVDEARAAATDSQFLNDLGAGLQGGHIEEVLSTLAPQSLENLADKFIPALMKTNKELFQRATGPFIMNILNDAYEQGEQSGNENLKKSVIWMSKFLTGKAELPKRFMPRQPDPKLLEERAKFDQERKDFFQKQANGFVSSAENAVFNGLNKMLRGGLLKEGEELSSFVQNAIIRETIEEVKSITNNDKQFMAMMSELFRRSQKAGFDQESKSRVVSAYLGRVKDISLKIRAKKKAEALGRQRKEVNPNPAPTPKTGNPQPRKIAPIPNKREMSELDIIRSR